MHLIGDFATFFAYSAIALALYRLVSARPDFQLNGVTLLFAAFVFGCGLTHLFSAVTLWWPAYGLQGMMKLSVALISVAAAVAAWKLLPIAIAYPSAQELKEQNDRLAAEIDERCATEAKLRQREVELTTASHRARCADAAKSNFLAAMSHDLRTPLNAIIGFSETMKLGVLGNVENAAHRDYIEHIHASGKNLLGIVENLLDLSRIEHGTFNFAPEVIDIASVSRFAVSESQTVANERGIRLKAHYDEPSITCFADESGVYRIVSNLLGNALRYSPDNSIVQFAIKSSRDSVTLVVADEGQGFPAGKIDELREPFKKASNRSAGSGLGLAIVSEIIALHDGRMRLSNRPDGGALVVVRIPRGLDVLDIVEPLEALRA